MGGGERRRCEFQLLRYVPDAVRNEYVHIGVILREAATEDEASGDEAKKDETGRDGSGKTAWNSRARENRGALYAGLAAGALPRSRCGYGAAGRDGERAAAANDEDPGGRLMHILEESLSLNVQMTEPKAYLAESVPAGMEELMRVYVEPAPRERSGRLSGRAAIQSRMRSEFEHAGVWDLLRKKIAAAEYTRPGDPLRIDVGYRPNGVVRMFQAVSFDPGLETAKVLAFSAAALRAGVERIEKAGLELTAVIEPAARVGATDEEPERLELYRFGVETMEEHGIRVLTTSDMGRVAETARRELRV